MNLTVAAIACDALLIQWFLSAKVKRIRYLPAGVIAIGMLLLLILCFGKWGSGSPSVISENRYFAAFIGKPLGAALFGCVAGHLASIFRK